MPEIRFQGRIAVCEPGKRLRDALLDAGMSPHHPAASIINCHGLGTCGTCAVAIEGAPDAVDPPTRRERIRLRVPPHRPESGLRLACQCRVNGDLVVTKHGGFWGQRVERSEDVSESRSEDRLQP